MQSVCLLSVAVQFRKAGASICGPPPQSPVERVLPDPSAAAIVNPGGHTWWRSSTVTVVLTTRNVMLTVRCFTVHMDPHSPEGWTAQMSAGWPLPQPSRAPASAPPHNRTFVFSSSKRASQKPAGRHMNLVAIVQIESSDIIANGGVW